MADTGYITKESALSCFHDWIDRYGHEHTADEMTEYQWIEELPEEDVRPVVHGRWLIKGHKMMGKTPCCSECGKFEPMKRNYCPNCGADMREEGDRENG